MVLASRYKAVVATAIAPTALSRAVERCAPRKRAPAEHGSASRSDSGSLRPRRSDGRAPVFRSAPRSQGRARHARGCAQSGRSSAGQLDPQDDDRGAGAIGAVVAARKSQHARTSSGATRRSKPCARRAPARTGSRCTANRRCHVGVTIAASLLYHRAGAPPSLSVSPERFDRQMRWLARLGFAA